MRQIFGAVVARTFHAFFFLSFIRGVHLVAMPAVAYAATQAGANAPEVSVTIEPAEDDKVVFLPVAAEASPKHAKAQLSLRLAISNQEKNAVHLNKVELMFPGPP